MPEEKCPECEAQPMAEELLLTDTSVSFPRLGRELNDRNPDRCCLQVLIRPAAARPSPAGLTDRAIPSADSTEKPFPGSSSRRRRRGRAPSHQRRAVRLDERPRGPVFETGLTSRSRRENARFSQSWQNPTLKSRLCSHSPFSDLECVHFGERALVDGET
jgi:hypothetical protein